MPYEIKSHPFINSFNTFFILIFSYFFIFPTLCFNFKQVGRNSLSRIINQRTSYSFVLDRTTDNTGVTTAWNSQTVPPNGDVAVQFPTQYQLTGTQTCNSIIIVSGTTNIQTFSPTSYSCSVSGNRLIFIGALSSIPDLFIRNITLNYGNVLNPSPALRTGEFTGYLGNDIALANGNTWIQLASATFSSCYITFGNGSFVNQTSPAIFNFTLLNQLNSSSSIRITFPALSKVWTNDISQSILPIQTGSMSCTGLSNSLSNPTCVGNYASFTVQASSIFSSVMSSGEMVSFQINNFISPPTLEPADSIRITSLTNGFEVDSCSTTVSDLKPKFFEDLFITPINSLMKVNTNVGFRINMTFSDTIDQNDAFRITFPNDLGVTYTSVSTSGSSEGVSSLNGQVLSVNQNVNFNVVYYKDYFMVINFYTIKAPPSTKQTQPIIVEILRNGYQKMIGSASVKATESSLVCDVSPQSLLVSAQTFYVFTITLNDKLSSGGWLQVFFPPDITLDSSAAFITGSGTNINSHPIINVDSLLGKVTITSLNSSSSFINVQTLTLSIGTITNPGTTKPTGSFSIKSYYQSGSQYLVAVGTCNGITSTAGILKNSDISITKSSDIVLATNVNYIISFVTNSVIPQNGVIKIEIPNDIHIDLNNLQSNCYQNVNQSSSVLATCSAILNTSTNKYQMTITSIALNGNLVGNSSISIQLQGISTNPDTTRNIVGFTINTYSADNYLIEGANVGISTRANTPAECVSVNVSRISNKNSETTNYTISLKQPSNIFPSSYLIITLPTQLQLTNTTSCTDLTGSVILSCTIQSNVITVQLSSQNVNNMTLFGIILTNVINTPSYEPLNQNFSILTKTPDNLNRYCQYNNPFTFQNNFPSLFSSIDGTFTPRIHNQLTSLIINFTPSSRVIPAYLVVSVATQLIVESLTCSFQGIVNGICTQTSTNIIKIQGSFTANSMQFTLGGIKAPKFSPQIPQYSSVSSFSSSNYKIDESVNLISFIVKCTLPCKTCTDSNVSECLSCYQDITISTSIYYLSSLKNCFSVCPDGYFANSAVLSCTVCNSVCNTCSMTADNCTSCKLNTTFKYFHISTSNTGICLSQCPTFYYPNSLDNCVGCQSPCNQCTSKTDCISCIAPFYMYNGSCTSQCPSGTTVPNDATRKCDLCSSVCATCSGNINNCVSCSADAAFYNGSCTVTCPPPLVINAGQCAGCDPICKQCSLRASNCTKCDTSSGVPYFYNFTCLSDCPSEYYKDLLNGLCKKCSDLNIGCRFCSGVSTCISCDSGFIFLNNKCYSNVPNGYYNENGQAKPCAGDCATCIDYATKCTSCKTLNLDGYDCVSTCPSTKVPVNKVCTQCQSPCLACSNIPTNCTSCVPNLNPQVFLNNYYCTETCPDYTYPNQTTIKCQSCQSPCLKCTSLSSCLSCVNGKFLLGSTCYDICPNGYIGINKVCQPCSAPCMTCQITTNRCLSCQDNFYLYNSTSPSCIQDCFSVNLYPDPILQICTGCQSPCVTCSTTSTTCTSCPQLMILFNNSCISQCPSGFYQQASSCLTCPTSCATCISSTVCQSCAFSFYFLLNYCVNSCPQDYPVITFDGKCQKCSDIKCKNCTQNDYCQQCLQPYFFHFGMCLERCPTDYNQTINSTNNFRQCVYAPPVVIVPNITENITITETLKSGGNLFPIPLTIASAFIGVAAIMSKFQNHFTFISGVLYSLWGLTQWASVGIMLWYFYQSYGWNHTQFYILGGSFAFLYLLNLLALLIQNINLLGDINFNKWLNMGSNKCFYYFVSITSFFTTHKFKNFIFSKMFNFVFLKAKLDSVQQFRVFNAFSFLSFLSSAGILFGMGLTFWTYEQTIDQKLMFFIDATVLTAVNIVLAILNSRKDNDFFQQKTEDGFTVHKRIQDYDELLYGGILPYESEQKFDHFETTGKKLMTAYETRYKNLQSDISEQSVRVIDVSIQAEQILDDQSVITHLNDEGMSDLDFFDRKQVSIQFDQLPVEVHDKSISMIGLNQKHDKSVSMIEFEKNEVHDKSVSMMKIEKNEISVQMEGICQNEISVQVSNEKEQVSVQYGPNVLDHSIGMSRQQAQISIQANPMFEQVSIQYSAKPVFVDIDGEYETGNQVISGQEDQFQQQGQKTIENQPRYFSRIGNEKQQLILEQNSINQSYLTARIKKPDTLLQPQLQLDINEKLMKRESQLRAIYQQEKEKERLRIISDFQKKQSLQKKPQNYKLNNVIQQVFVPQPRNQLLLQHTKEDKIHYSHSGTIMDSNLDILNIDRVDIVNMDGVKQFESSESRVKERVQSQSSNLNQSIGGQSEKEFIQMLSSRKMSQNQDQDKYKQNQNQKQQNKNINLFNKKINKVLYVEEYEQLQDSNQISLNMTQQVEHNHPTQNPQNNKLKGINLKFQNKNQNYHQDHDQNHQSHQNHQNHYSHKEHQKQNEQHLLQHPDHQYQNQHHLNFDQEQLQYQDHDNFQQNNKFPLNQQSSKQHSKSISTKNMTRINKKQPLSKGIQQGSLLDSSNDIQNSSNSQINLTQQILFSPLKPLSKNTKTSSKNHNNLNFINQNSNYLNDSSLDSNNNNEPQYFTQNFTRNLQSASIIRNYKKQSNIQPNINDDSMSGQYQNQSLNQKQSPLPLPIHQINNLQQNQLQSLQFGDSQKVIISPLNSQQMRTIQPCHSELPLGVNSKFPKITNKKRNLSKNQINSTNIISKKKTSRSKEKPVQNELLNPSTSIKGIKIAKQLEKQEKKAENRKRNIELMEGMLQRPSHGRKLYLKEEEQEGKRNQVQKIYLNRQKSMFGK